MLGRERCYVAKRAATKTTAQGRCRETATALCAGITVTLPILDEPTIVRRKRCMFLTNTETVPLLATTEPRTALVAAKLSLIQLVALPMATYGPMTAAKRLASKAKATTRPTEVTTTAVRQTEPAAVVSNAKDTDTTDTVVATGGYKAGRLPPETHRQASAVAKGEPAYGANRTTDADRTTEARAYEVEAEEQRVD